MARGICDDCEQLKDRGKCACTPPNNRTTKATRMTTHDGLEQIVAEMRDMATQRKFATIGTVDPVRGQLIAFADRLAALTAPEPDAAGPVAWQFQDRDGVWFNFHDAKHREDTIASGEWPIRALYATPPSAPREPADTGDAVAWTVVGPDDKSSIGGWHDMASYSFMWKVGVLREGHRYAFATARAAAPVVVDESALARAEAVAWQYRFQFFDGSWSNWEPAHATEAERARVAEIYTRHNIGYETRALYARPGGVPAGHVLVPVDEVDRAVKVMRYAAHPYPSPNADALAAFLPKAATKEPT